MGMERTAVESMDSTELEKFLREDFYDGEGFRQLVNEPFLYGVAAWVIVAYLAFMMRGDIGYEWTASTRDNGAAMVIELWRRSAENREGITSRR
jgi:hypothetical protein